MIKGELQEHERSLKYIWIPQERYDQRIRIAESKSGSSCPGNENLVEIVGNRDKSLYGKNSHDMKIILSNLQNYSQFIEADGQKLNKVNCNCRADRI